MFDTTIVGRIIALSFAVLGLSYLIQTERWLAYLLYLAKAPERIFPIGIFLLPMGALIVCGGEGIVGEGRVLILVLGWMLVVKSAVYLILPGEISRFVSVVGDRLGLLLRISGVLSVGAGAVLFSLLR